ncbi:uncharacterized protein LOC120738236 [Simochromis diagramma]|uniref:uncharacterized protein LOC120738236 n=1 Tax=Simochromis diagramma TaxID=43689 RepID=UPI001A7E7746|nr:uncharacterized protein LOC120738236 [Simochromis diagramma]
MSPKRCWKASSNEPFFNLSFRKFHLALITTVCVVTGTGCDAPPQREQTPSDRNTGSQKTKYLTIIRAVRGQDVVLPCQVHKDYPIAAVVWRRIDVKPVEVLLYQSKTSHQANKYPPSRSRMHLMDRRMNNGNLSSALQNVPESGIYECLAIDTEMHQWKTPTENADTINTIQLIIDPEAPTLNAGERQFAPPTSLLVFLILGLLSCFCFSV